MAFTPFVEDYDGQLHWNGDVFEFIPKYVNISVYSNNLGSF